MDLHLKIKLFYASQLADLFRSGLIAIFLFLQTNIALAEDSNWQQWATHNQHSLVEIDHSTWNRVLKTYVHTNSFGQNMFDYASVSPADQRAIKHYLEMLSTVDVQDLNKNEQLAFWINAYNAIVVRVILKEYPVESILDVGGDVFNRGPWNNHYFSVGGVPISLSNIRREIIFTHWQDVRVIYALSCGAIGCPNLGAKAVIGRKVNGYLDAAAMAFINGPVAILKFDNDSVKTSKLFYWSKGEFIDHNVNILEHIKTYAVGDMARKLKNVENIRGYGFNWQLNDIYRE